MQGAMSARTKSPARTKAHHLVQVWVVKPLVAEATEIARQDGVTLSDLVRRAVRNEVTARRVQKTQETDDSG